MVSFGVRGDSFVVGTITAEEVLDEQNPFQNLISGAGWLVRAGVNHVEASARDGHLDGGALDDLLVAKLARTAIGHDSEGRLILLQVRAWAGRRG
ncbi:unnamed protein product, partial [Ectocarpus sp. 8 AP-2014]